MLTNCTYALTACGLAGPVPSECLRIFRLFTQRDTLMFVHDELAYVLTCSASVLHLLPCLLLMGAASFCLGSNWAFALLRSRGTPTGIIHDLEKGWLGNLMRAISSGLRVRLATEDTSYACRK